MIGVQEPGAAINVPQQQCRPESNAKQSPQPGSQLREGPGVQRLQQPSQVRQLGEHTERVGLGAGKGGVGSHGALSPHCTVTPN